MRIGIDVDGVVLDFARRWTDAHYEWFGEKLRPPMVSRTLETALHRTKVMEWFDRANIWAEMPWIPGAKYGLDALAGDHNLAFLTSRPLTGQQALASLPWLRGNVYSVRSRDKAKVLCSLYIDDAIDDAVRLRKAGMPTMRFGYEPFKTWRAIVDEIELIVSGDASTELIYVEDPRKVRARERHAEMWRNLHKLANDADGITTSF